MHRVLVWSLCIFLLGCASGTKATHTSHTVHSTQSGSGGSVHSFSHMSLSTSSGDAQTAVSSTHIVLPSAGSLQGLPSPSPWPDLTQSAPVVGGGERDAALVVGVRDYVRVPDILGADENARAWVQYLHRARRVPLGKIALLQNADATKEEMEYALEKVARNVEEGGTVWFVFVGHGAASQDGRDGLFIGADAKQTAMSIQARSVSKKHVLARLKESAAGHVIAVVDTCFSGQVEGHQSIAPGLQPLVPWRESERSMSDVTLFTAGKSDQFAGPLPKGYRPAMSYLLLGALRGWGDTNKDGEVTAQEARDYVHDTLQFSLGGTRKQDPQLYTSSPARVLTRSKNLEQAPDVLRVLHE